jgi:hypothetical protein
MANKNIIPRFKKLDTSDEATVASFLPRLYRTDANKKFLHSTINQLTQSGQIKKVSGYIGRQYAKSTTSDEVFVDAPTNPRQNYQLEPGFIIDDEMGNTVFLKDYQDYINQLNVSGANVSNHSRLNKQEFYSWNPHINWDMFVNFQNYYWMPHGPDTVTIQNTLESAVVSTYQVSVDTTVSGSTYVFSPDGLTKNPAITLFRGHTYTFKIDSIGNPFSIKTRRTTGLLDRYITPFLTTDVFETVKDTYGKSVKSMVRAITSGTITFKVPHDAPDELIYVSETNIDMGGIFIILDPSDTGYINVTSEIVGKKTYKINDIVLSNGMKVQFAGSVYPANYATGRYYVEGVGSSIQLVNEKDLEIITPYTSSKSMLFDDTLFDTTPFSDSASYITNPDYIVINRASIDRNYWSRNNKWIHKDVIEKSSLINGMHAMYDQTLRAVRPIIEFDKNLKLFNFGTTAIADVDVIDNFTTDAFSNVEGSLGYNIDSINLRDGHRVIFTADTDPLVTNNIYEVKFINVLHEIGNRSISATGTISQVTAVNSGWSAVITGLTSTTNLVVGSTLIATPGTGRLYSGTVLPDAIKVTSILSPTSIEYTVIGGNTPVAGTISNIGTTVDSSRQIRLVKVSEPSYGQVALVKEGTQSQGKMYWYNGTYWNNTQRKIASNQAPLFDIVDNDFVSIGDKKTYPGTTFNGTSIFSYKVGTGTVDTNLGFALSYKNINNIGDIVFNFSLITDTFRYELNDQTITSKINTGFLVEFDNNGKMWSVNGWETAKINNTQAAICLYKDSNIVNDFDINIFDTLPSVNDIEVRVYVNNVRVLRLGNQLNVPTEVNEWQLVSSNSKKSDLPYHQIHFKNDVQLTDIVLIKVFSLLPINRNGFYEIPINLQNNPLNGVLSEFTLGEVIDHVGSIVDNIYTSGFTGVYPGISNLRDMGNVSQFGTKFVQHSGPASLSVYHITSDTNNIIRAIDQSRDDYCTFKKSFLTIAGSLGIDAKPFTHVNTILQEMFKNMSKTAPYYFSDMVPYNAKTQVDFTVAAPEDNIFSLSAVFNLTKLSYKAVSVYLNDEQLLHSRDYEFNDQGFVIVSAPLVTGDIVTIYEYDSTDGCLIPETPTKLGLWPKYEPRIFLDTSLVNPRIMIQGHDGSLTAAYEDYRDELVLELEKRIYNNIKIEYNPQVFDLTEIIPSYSRTTDYSLQEFNSILMPNFNKWASAAGVDFSTVLTFDKTNSFTYNYANHTAPDGRVTPAYWRGIYQWLLDTDRPHLCPWEMLGFTEEPMWWTEVYGPAPYTSNNLILWEDISKGIIREPDMPVVIVPKYVKPFLLDHIPVDAQGKLISPYYSKLANGAEVRSYQGDFSFGDGSPVETAWRRNSHYAFSVLKTAILMYPSKTIGTLIDRARLIRNNANQLIYLDTGLRITPASIKFPSVYLSDSRLQTAGLINYLINFINCDKLDVYNNYKTELETITAKICYRVSAFTSKEKFNLLLDSKSPTSTGSIFIPQEDYKIVLNTSSPIAILTYSGVIITKIPQGFELKGYSQLHPYFKYYKPDAGHGYTINIGGISEGYMEWGIGNYYAEGNIVKYNNKYYRVLSTHTATAFDTAIYFEISSLPITGGIDVVFKTQWKTEASILQYGARLETIQDVVDFLLGYGEWLKVQGFMFDEFNSELESVSNWETSAKEFLFWVPQNWTTPTVVWKEWEPNILVSYGDIIRYNGDFYKAVVNTSSGWFNEDEYYLLNGVDLTGNSVISLSPASQKLIFNTILTVIDNVNNPINVYEILDGSGSPISTHLLNTFRVDNAVSYQPRNDSGIYCASFYLVQKEHIVVINNTTMFNDTIYNLESGYKQDKLKVSAYVSIDWNGSLNVPGFIVDRALAEEWTPWKPYAIGDIVKHKSFYYSSNMPSSGESTFDNTQWVKLSKKPQPKLLPNWNYKASQFTDFYSLDSENFESEQQQMAQHLVGYQKRQYLENIIQDDVSEYKFYQGMIIEKGTQNVLNKLFDVLSAADQESLQFYEEWAVRVGQYGASSSFENVEFVLPETHFTTNPQGFQLVNERTVDSNIVIQQIPSEVYLKPNSFTPNVWPVAKSVKTATVYARLDEVTLTLQKVDDLLALPDASVIAYGDYILCTFAPTDWNVYQYVNRTNTYNITDITNSDAVTVNFVLDDIKDLQVGTLLSINDTHASIIHEVNKVYVQYNGISQWSTTGIGTGATFEIIRTALTYEAILTSAGSNYAVNDTITILGSQLGGVITTNNLIITVVSVIDTGINEISVLGTSTAVVGAGIIDISTTKSYSLSKTQIVGSFVSRRIKKTIDNTNYKIEDIAPGVKLWTDNDQVDTDFYDDTSNWKVWEYNPIYTRAIKSTNSNSRITKYGRASATTENGKTIVVSAITNENLTTEGSVMIYSNTVLQGWVLSQVILSRVSLYNKANFATVVAMSTDGAWLAIGSPTADRYNQGSILVYKKDTSNVYVLDNTIVSPDPVNGEQFGSSLTFGNNVLFVGTAVGKVYQISYKLQLHATAVYISVGSNGAIIKLSSIDNIAQGMLVSGKGFSETATFVTSVISDITSIQVSLEPSDEPAGAIDFLSYEWVIEPNIFTGSTNSLQFGMSVAVSSNNTLIISEPYNEDDINHVLIKGKVYVYPYSSGSYSNPFIIHAPDNSTIFGKHIAISKNDDYIAISSLIDDVSAYEGTVAIYKFNHYDAPTQVISSPSLAVSGEFGSNIKFINDFSTIVVGHAITPLLIKDATFHDVVNGTSIPTKFSTFINSVYSSAIDVFDKYEQTWIFSERLTPIDPVINNATFGASVIVTPTSVIVGAPESNNQAGVMYEFKKPALQYTWKIKNKVIPKPDITKIKQAFLYNKSTNKLIKYLDVVDPIQNKHPLVAEREIKYKFPYDPAVYTVGTTDVNVDEGIAWTTDQIGTLWWDLRTTKFVDNFTDNVVYRNSMLSTLAYGASVDVYEWVASRFMPSEWDKRADTEAGLALNISGKSLYGDSVYSSVKRYDTLSQTFSYVYFFWVKNKEIATPGRTVSAAEISRLISNPKGEGYEYLALTGLDSFSLVNIKSLLLHNDVVLSVEYWTVDKTDQNIHTQWKLISNSPTTTLPVSIENKWIDSLCGKDINNRLVPNLLLPVKIRYGIENRPRQSMFVNRFEALKQLFEHVNLSLASTITPIVDTRNLTNLKKYDEVPNVLNRLYDTTFDTDSELRFAITKYFKSPILTAVVVDGKITDVIIDEPGRGYLIAPSVKIYGSGSSASLKTTINSAGQITSVSIENSGSNYDSSTRLVVRSFSVLILSDSASNGKWSIYSYVVDTNSWVKTLSYAYDVTKYWDYKDWYATGVNQFTVVHHSVDTYAELYQLNTNIGDVVKVRVTNAGRWVLLQKYKSSTSIDWTRSYKVIGSENGTLQFSPLLYNFKDTAIGFDGAIYDSLVYDNYADTELRIILNAIKDDLLIDDLKVEYLKLFFTSVRYALSEQTYVDWIFKTSFVNVMHNVGYLRQSATYKNDNLSNFEDYVSEVKPYRTQVREYISGYGVLDTNNTGVSDFDLPAAYDSSTKKIDVVNNTNPLINTYPWKSWLDNVGYSIVDIQITDGGSDYITDPLVVIESSTGSGATAKAFVVNKKVVRIKLITPGSKYITEPTVKIMGGFSGEGTAAKAVAILGDSVIRTSNIKLKFDRIYQDYVIDDLAFSEQLQNVTDSKVQYVLKWLPDLTIGKTTVTINGQTEIRDNYTIGTVSNIVNGHPVYTGVITFKTAPSKNSVIVVSYYKDNELLNATDRIQYYYKPESGELGKDLPQLMSGIDYGGVAVGGLNFNVVHGWDSVPYYTDTWDNFNPNINDVSVAVGTNFSYSIEMPYTPEKDTRFNVYYKKLGSINVTGTLNGAYTADDTTALVENMKITFAYNTGDVSIEKDYFVKTFSSAVFTITDTIGAPAIYVTGNDTNIANYYLSTVRIDDPSFVVGVITHDNPRAIMVTPIATGDTNIIEIPSSVNAGKGDVFTIRKETSDGSSVNDYDTILSGGEFTLGSAAGLAPEEINIDGDEFYSTVNGYGPEEVVPGQVVDTLAIKVFTKSTTNTAFMQVKDMLNAVKYIRLLDSKKTKLAKDLLQTDTTITVLNSAGFGSANQLANSPGVIDINGERIEYFTNENNVLGGLRRGTMGTGVAEIHKADSVVQDIGKAETISYNDTVRMDQFVSDGTGIVTLTYTPSKSNDTWTFPSTFTSTIPAGYGQSNDIEVFVGGYKDDAIWTANTYYAINDIVNVGVYTYRCLIPHTSGDAFKTDRIDFWSYFIGNIRLKKAPFKIHNMNNGPSSPDGDVQFDADFSVDGTSKQIRLTYPVTPGTLITVIKKTGIHWGLGAASVISFINSEVGSTYEPPVN